MPALSVHTFIVDSPLYCNKDVFAPRLRHLHLCIVIFQDNRPRSAGKLRVGAWRASLAMHVFNGILTPKSPCQCSANLVHFTSTSVISLS